MSSIERLEQVCRIVDNYINVFTEKRSKVTLKRSEVHPIYLTLKRYMYIAITFLRTFRKLLTELSSELRRSFFSAFQTLSGRKTNI